MAESFVSLIEEVHEGTGSCSDELDPNFSSSSFYLLGVVNQSQNASFGVEEAMFRPESPTFKEVLEQVYFKCLDTGAGDVGEKQGPSVSQVVDTVRGFLFQTDDGGVGNESEMLLNSLSVELELQKSPGDYLTREGFNLAMESWIHSVGQQKRCTMDGACITPFSDRSEQYSNPLEQTHSLTGSYSLEGTGGSGRRSECLSERVEELLRYSDQLESENTLLKEQLLENEETISELTETKNILERQLTGLKASLQNNHSITLENSALKQELSKLDSSLSQTKLRLFQETKHRQTLETELQQCSKTEETNPSVVHGDTYIMESYGDSVQQDSINEIVELQNNLDVATREITLLSEQNDHLHQRLTFLTEKNEELCQQIADLEQEMGQRSVLTSTSVQYSTPTAKICPSPSLEQELTGAVYTSPVRTKHTFLASTPLNSLHVARESIFDQNNSSLELLESLSSDPKWKELCSLKSLQSDVITQKTNEIMSDLDELDCGQAYADILHEFRAKHLHLQSELEESLRLRGESEKEVTLLRDEMKQLREQINKLQQQLQNASHAKSHGDTLIAEVSTKDGVIKQLSGELEDLSQRLALSDSEAVENAKLLTSIQAKTTLIQQLMADKQQLENKLNEVTNQLQIQATEMQNMGARNVDLNDQLIQTGEVLKAKTEEVATTAQSHQQILAEYNTQQTSTARITDQLQQTSNELEIFQQEHTACLKELWLITQDTPTSNDPSFQPTFQQVRDAITQRTHPSSIAKHNTSLTSHSLPSSPTRTPQNNPVNVSITPTAFSPDRSSMLIPANQSPCITNAVSIEERVRAIQVWYSSARYTTKPTYQAWKQHAMGLETKIHDQLIELERVLVNKDYKQAGKLLKMLKNSINVLMYSSCRVGRLEQECWDLNNYCTLLEYIDLLKRTPHDSPTRSLNSSRHRHTPRGGNHSNEGIFGNGMFETQKNLFPDLREEFDGLRQREKALQLRADNLAKTLNGIKPVSKGVTFRGIVFNFHLTLSLFLLMVLVYLLLGPFPESLPIIRHKLVFGPVFSFSRYFISNSDFTPIV